MAEAHDLAEQGPVQLHGAALRQGAHRAHPDDGGGADRARPAGEVRDLSQLGVDPAELGVLGDQPARPAGDGEVQGELRGRGQNRLVVPRDVQIRRNLRQVTPDHGHGERGPPGWP
ncbi:hypothetical protein [Streptomyces sp. bgisy060]|uniref:hypothetical protein n=1 Tax=Streptomyces sp. bgisy060 TaxID=3413775 RepID=UPI003EB96B90